MRHPNRSPYSVAGARRLAMTGAVAALLVAGLGGCVIVTPDRDADRDHDGMGGMSGGSQSTEDFSQGDVMFAQMMIPHHEQAIEMSDLILDKEGVAPDVAELAEEIKAAQGPEIEQMEDWLDEWGVPSMMDGGHGGHGGMDGMLTDEEMDEIESADGATGERLFLEGMIEHHEGAIAMAEQHQENGENEDTLELSASIIESQTAEIERMEELLGR
ncbi:MULTISPECIES: DUF305 domain-containing protein [unclassified Agromyces]|uniref:DUF305 domain-containing protein n=1 Tax=unclassified Agromyces TaxID=2639701 RepID=UPI0030156850